MIGTIVLAHCFVDDTFLYDEPAIVVSQDAQTGMIDAYVFSRSNAIKFKQNLTEGPGPNQYALLA